MRRSWGACQVGIGGAVLAGVALFLLLGASKASLPSREVVMSIVSKGIGRIAAVAEMMDRTRSGIWSEDLATVLASW